MKNTSKSILAVHSLAYLGTNIFISLISLLTIPLLTKFLSPAEYGTMGIYLAITNGVLWCLELGIPVRRAYVLNQATPKRLSEDVGVFLVFYFISILPIFALTVLFWNAISGWVPISLWLVMAALLNGYFLTYLSISYGLWLISQCAYMYSLFKISLSLLNLGLIILGLFCFSLGWVSVALASLVSSLVVLLISLRDIVPRFHVTMKLDKKIIGRNLKILSPIILLNISLAIVGNAGPILVAYYVNISESGLYLLAFQITAAIPLFYDSVASAILPYLVSDNKHAPSKYLTKTTIISAYIVALCGLTALFIFTVPFVIRWILPPAYSLAIPFITWLAVARCLGGISRPIVEMVMYKTPYFKQVSFYYFLAAPLYLGITILLLKQYGAAGGGMGLAFAYITRIIIILPFALKLRHATYSSSAKNVIVDCPVLLSECISSNFQRNYPKNE